MSIKDFMYTEKGKIGASVLAAVLITAAVLVPVSIFTDRAINGNELYKDGVATYGYDSQVSSTAEKANDYMEITKQKTQNVFGDAGDMVLSGEPTLLENPLYNSMLDDIQILNGVYDSQNAMGYLTLSQVMAYVSGGTNPLIPLMVEDKKDGAMISPIDGDNQAPNPAYQAANESHLTSTLNTHLRVSSEVANELKTYMFLNEDGKINDLWKESNPIKNSEKDEFTKWLIENKLEDKFGVSFILFNYMLFDQSNYENLSSGYLGGTNLNKVEMDPSTNLDVFVENYNSYITSQSGDDYNLKEEIYSASYTDVYDVLIDGTGTNSGIMIEQFNNFNDDMNTDSSTFKGIKLNYNLKNGGSGQGWETAQEGSFGAEDNSTDDGRQGSFIGTQSRPTKLDEITDWGYSEVSDSPADVYSPASIYKEGNPISITMGIDLTTFFVKDNLTFQVSLSEEDIKNHSAVDKKSGNSLTGKMIFSDIEYSFDNSEIRTFNVKPIGITSNGAKAIYENGISWETAYNYGWIFIEIISVV